MASVIVSSHVFKSVDNLDLKLELFQKSSDIGAYNPNTPVILFIHGGGFVGFNREHVPPHVVQLSLLRGWPLMSTDYRLLPQVKGKDVFEDVKDAYEFVRQKLPSILAGREVPSGAGGTVKNIILVGQSAGSYLAYMGGLYLSPSPLAILGYYGFATVDEPYFSQRKPDLPKLVPHSQIETYLQESVTTNMTPDFNCFDPSCLLKDLTRNPDYVRPEINSNNPADRRMLVTMWLIQEHGLQSWFEGLDKSLDDEVWRKFPEAIIVHGDADMVTPIEGSKKLIDILGPVPPKLFVAKGKGHSFDQPLYLGDEEFEPIEKAWTALDEIVKRKLGYISE